MRCPSTPSRPSPCAGRSPGLVSGHRVPHPPAAFRAAPRPGELPLQAPQPLPLSRGQARHGQQLTRGQGRADSDAPVNADHLAVAWCRDRIGNGREGDMPAPGAVHRHPVGLPPGGTARDQRNRTHPALGTQTWPTFRDRRRTSHCRPRRPVIRNPSSRPALRHDGRPAGFAGRRTPPSPGRSRAAPAAVPSGSLRAATGARAGGGELPALLQVARRARPARAPVGVLLDGQVPHVPGVAAVVPQHRFLGGRGEQPVSRHANALSNTTDISGEVKRRVLLGLKARVSTTPF